MTISSFTFSKKNKEKEMQKIRQCNPDSDAEIVQTLNAIYNIRVLNLLFKEHKKITGIGKNYFVEIIKTFFLFSILSGSMISLMNIICPSFNIPVYFNIIFDFIILGFAFFISLHLFINEFYLKRQELILINFMLNKNKLNNKETMSNLIKNIQHNTISDEINAEKTILNKSITTSSKNIPDKPKNRI